MTDLGTDEEDLAEQSALVEASSDDDEDLVPAVEAKDYFGYQNLAAQPGITESPLPAIVVAESPAEQPVSQSSVHQPVGTAAPLVAPPHRRGLSLPQFIRRRTSTASVPSTATATPTDSNVTSDVETPVSTPGRQRRRFSRKSRSSKSTLDSTAGLTPTESNISSESLSKDKGKKRERVKRKTRRRKKAGEYTFDEGEDIAGLVQIEIKSAKGLPRWKNALRTG